MYACCILPYAYGIFSAFTIIILMLHIDVFMKVMMFQCSYDYFSNQTCLVYIDDLMKMMIFYWFYHHYWIVHHFNFI